MADTPEAIKKSIKLYSIIGGILFVCTVLTVAVAYVPALDFGAHGFDTADAVLGVFIATVKASLVAFIFMHLYSEKKMIYFLFGMGVFFGVVLILLFAFGFLDPITFDELLPSSYGSAS